MTETAHSRTDMSPASPIAVQEWRQQIGVTEAQLAAAKRASDYWARMGRIAPLSAAAPSEPARNN